MKNPKPVTLGLSDQQIVLLARAGVQAMFDMVIRGDKPAAPNTAAPALPEIGAEWNGGIYAGLSIHDNKPVALVLLPDEIEAATWDAARTWAGNQDGDLPSRLDQLVLFKNLKGQFKEASYWSGEQPAGGSASAWGQYFGYGYQYGWHKSDETRARAVRRVPI